MSISYFQARDYAQGALRQSHGKSNPVARSVLLFLLSNAVYGDARNYGQVIESWSGQETIAAVLGRNRITVLYALDELESAGLILRARGGRRSHRPDRISVLPILEKAEKYFSEYPEG